MNTQDAIDHIEECHIIIDLQREEIYELKAEVASLYELKAEVARLREALKEFKLQHRSDLVA